jgi:DtxR family transcriptional regulator, Mn-dependent transcriptional regulator
MPKDLVAHSPSRPPLSEAQEDYLKEILVLGSGAAGAGALADTQVVGTQALADKIGVKPASVSEMLKKLGELGLVEHERYRGVRLTEAGYKIALEILRHHRLLEAYLCEALGYGWEEVHAEAEKLEHHISEAFEARIAAWLGHPLRDPHGDPIPSAELCMPNVAPVRRLTHLASGETAQVVRVATQDEDSLNLLARLGLRPGGKLRVLEQHRDGVRVEITNKDHNERLLLPTSLGELLWLEVVYE